MRFERIPMKPYRGQVIRRIEKKMDGIWMQVVKTPQGVISCYNRHGCHIFPYVDFSRVPNDTVLRGELYLPGGFSTDVKSYLARYTEGLVFAPFAILRWCGRDCESSTDFTVSDERLRSMGYEPLRAGDVGDGCMLYPEKVEALRRMALKAKIEGYVFKEETLSGWYKVKPQRTVDAVILGYRLSTSKSFNKGIRHLDVGLYDEEGRLVEVAHVGSGLTKAFRMQGEGRVGLIGQVCEVAYDGLASKGRLRFPRFVQMRDDKTPNECTMDQLED